MNQAFPSAPELEISEWINTPMPITLTDLRGKIVLVHAFQMLCPGCVQHGIPQAMQVHQMFSRDEVVVLGLHSVFEHHAVMGPEALRAFVHEYRISFPVGIDHAQSDGRVPRTMQAYALRGTPSTILIDRFGKLRLQHFGRMDDLQLGAQIGRLASEARPPSMPTKDPGLFLIPGAAVCDETSCQR